MEDNEFAQQKREVGCEAVDQDGVGILLKYRKNIWTSFGD